MTNESKVVFKTDADGRLLCPECEARLYATVTVVYSGIPVFADPEQLRGLDCWNYDSESNFREANLSSLHCYRCSWRISADKFDEEMIQ